MKPSPAPAQQQENAQQPPIKGAHQAACVVAHLMGAEQMISMGWHERRSAEGAVRAQVESARSHNGLNAVQLRDTVSRIFPDAELIIEECLHVKRLHLFVPSFRLHAHLTHGAIEGVICYLADQRAYTLWRQTTCHCIALSNAEREAMRSLAGKTC